jgi:RNA polymerase sigma-70 factor, ECF subfamily
LRIKLSSTTEEAYLVKCCKDNEPAAQQQLYSRYAEDMMILCLRYIPGKEDAKEALMDGFLSFFRNINSFTWRGEGSVKAWLKKIIINNCLMKLRKRNMETVPVNETNYEQSETDDDILGGLAAKEILKLLHELPDAYRTVFNLYVFEEMNHREIAELTGIPENTSKSHLHRARAILKKQILLTN